MSDAPQTAAKPRRWRTFSLRTFLVVSLFLSVTLGYFGRAWLKAYRDSQPPTLYELAQIAKRHGIPMPPKEAKLVLAATGARYGHQYMYSPAFLLEELDDGGIRILRGTAESSWKADSLLYSWDDKPTEPLWREFSFDRTEHEQWKAQFNLRSAFVCAAQLADRGDVATAKAILSRIAEEKEWNDSLYDSEIAPELVDPRLLMARCVYDRLERRIYLEPNNWPQIRIALGELLAEFPKLGDERAAVLRDLGAALDAPAPKPKSNSLSFIRCGWGPCRMYPWYCAVSR